MITEQADERKEEQKWWFCARVKEGTRPGAWVVNGPFETYEQAMAAREKLKLQRLEVTTPFPASSRAEAETMCDQR